MVARPALVITAVALLVVGVPPLAAPEPAVRSAVGRASWYGHPYHGRRTASGETYDMNQLTAASPALPLGTRVEITNLRNGRSVHVRVNDRMPPASARLIDLSHAAAVELRAVRAGVIPVRLRVVSAPTRTGAEKDRRQG
jgi:rare lipoprotein A